MPPILSLIFDPSNPETLPRQKAVVAYSGLTGEPVVLWATPEMEKAVKQHPAHKTLFVGENSTPPRPGIWVWEGYAIPVPIPEKDIETFEEFVNKLPGEWRQPSIQEWGILALKECKENPLTYKGPCCEDAEARKVIFEEKKHTSFGAIATSFITASFLLALFSFPHLSFLPLALGVGILGFFGTTLTLGAPVDAPKTLASAAYRGGWIAVAGWIVWDLQGGQNPAISILLVAFGWATSIMALVDAHFRRTP